MDPTGLGPRARLFEPGERLGWIYRDPDQFRRPFGEPPPDEPPAVPAPSSATPPIWIPIAVGLLVMCAGGCCAGANSTAADDGVAALGLLGLLAGVAIAAGGPAMMLWSRNASKRSHRSRVAATRQAHQEEVRQWQARAGEFSELESLRVDRLPEWGAAVAGAAARRIDIYGGQLWSWEAFLTVFGSSMLGSHKRVTVLDLSHGGVSYELLSLAAGAGHRVDAVVLPDQLAECDLLAGLDTQQLIDVLIESIHGEEASGTFSVRAMDTRILSKICAALGPDVTLGRLGEAIRTLMGEPATGDNLTRAERDRIIDELFSAEYVQASYDNLSRIEAHVYPLERLGNRAAAPPDAALRAVLLRGDGPSAREDLLPGLLVQWVMRSLVGMDGPAQDSVLVVAGADALPRRHLERLSDISGRRNVRLVYLFRHLRESSLHLLDGAVVGFMRLGNRDEAEAAANFIGRQHSFVLSQLTKTTGGNDTHTESVSEGWSQAQSFFGGRQMLPNRSRTWGGSTSYAAGTNWSAGSTTQRVYEYRVEPTTLQGLPDYAMLLVRADPSGPITVAVDCNPDLVYLPRLINTPLPSAAEVEANIGLHPVIEPAPTQVTRP